VLKGEWGTGRTLPCVLDSKTRGRNTSATNLPRPPGPHTLLRHGNLPSGIAPRLARPAGRKQGSWKNGNTGVNAGQLPQLQRGRPGTLPPRHLLSVLVLPASPPVRSVPATLRASRRRCLQHRSNEHLGAAAFQGRGETRGAFPERTNAPT